MTTNYRLARSHLINAFLALEGDTPEAERLQRATELLLEAVARAERDGRRSNVLPFSKQGFRTAPATISRCPGNASDPCPVLAILEP